MQKNVIPRRRKTVAETPCRTGNREAHGIAPFPWRQETDAVGNSWGKTCFEFLQICKKIFCGNRIFPLDKPGNRWYNVITKRKLKKIKVENVQITIVCEDPMHTRFEDALPWIEMARYVCRCGVCERELYTLPPFFVHKNTALLTAEKRRIHPEEKRI